MPFALVVSCSLFFVCIGLSAKEPNELLTTELAKAFGSAPAIWGARLSPDGSKISLLRMHEQGATTLVILDTATGKANLALSGERDRFVITWCDWANSERLLCGFRAVKLDGTIAYALTRLVAVNHDGSNSRELLSRQLRYTFAQFQDNVVDWLPDDDEHVLVQVPSEEGSGVGRLNIYDGQVVMRERDRFATRRWISDGHGVARLYYVVNEGRERWDVREQPREDAAWSALHEARVDDLTDGFSPIGFGEKRNEVLYFDEHQGRTALFALDLEQERKSRLVFAHPAVDVASVHTLGKFRRLVAVSYITDRPHLEFFDQRIADIHGRVARTFPGKQVAVLDEDWSQRFYLIHVGSEADPGTYYRFDVENSVLMAISPAYPSLRGHDLQPMREIRYPAADGTEIPAYLTLPAGAGMGPKPAIVLPHGGPSSRDYVSYDFVAQFLAANGYVVLQSNYRGSDGYGERWRGAGGFKDWRVAIGDITDGAEYLVREGIADSERICVVGWSYGGYAALMSAIEQPERYRCVVSIAGVTDPLALGFNSAKFVGGRAAQAFIGVGDEIAGGSPVKRAGELAVPVLLFHPRRDLNVPFAQSEALARNLTRARRPAELIEYEYAEHGIEPERYRIDMLARIGAFLGEHLRAQ